MKKLWIKLCTLTGQIVWYGVMMIAAGLMVFLYMRDQKAAEKQEAATLEKPVAIAPEAEPELRELTPVSFSQPVSNAEKMADVKRKAKSRQAKNKAIAKAEKPESKAKESAKPVTYAKETPSVAPAKKKGSGTGKAAKTEKAEKPQPAATKRVAPTSEQIRNMAINSAERLDYGGDTWEQTKAVAFSNMQKRSAAIEENEAWSMEKKQAAAEAIRKQQAEKSAVQKFFGL